MAQFGAGAPPPQKPPPVSVAQSGGGNAPWGANQRQGNADADGPDLQLLGFPPGGVFAAGHPPPGHPPPGHPPPGPPPGLAAQLHSVNPAVTLGTALAQAQVRFRSKFRRRIFCSVSLFCSLTRFWPILRTSLLFLGRHFLSSSAGSWRAASGAPAVRGRGGSTTLTAAAATTATGERGGVGRGGRSGRRLPPAAAPTRSSRTGS